MIGERLAPHAADTAPAVLRQRLRRDGVVLLTGLLERDEVIACREAVRAVLRDEGWVDEDLAPVGPVHRIGSPGFHRCIERVMAEERLHQLAQSPHLVDLASALLGGPAFAHPRKMVRISYPTTVCPQDRIPPHQDAFYVRGEADTLTFWIPFADLPVGTGGLQVAEGSHHDGLYPVAPNDEGRFQCSATDLPEGGMRWSGADYAMGDVLVFHSLTVHGSGVNVGGAMRLSMDCRYSRAAGHVNAEQLLPPYHPDVAAWDELSDGWSDPDRFRVPPELLIDDPAVSIETVLARPSTLS